MVIRLCPGETLIPRASTLCCTAAKVQDHATGSNSADAERRETHDVATGKGQALSAGTDRHLAGGSATGGTSGVNHRRRLHVGRRSGDRRLRGHVLR